MALTYLDHGNIPVGLRIEEPELCGMTAFQLQGVYIRCLEIQGVGQEDQDFRSGLTSVVQ